MSAPDVERWRPDPAYIRSLIDATGLSQRAVARRIGIGERLMRDYASGGKKVPYTVQFAIERLAIR